MGEMRGRPRVGRDLMFWGVLAAGIAAIVVFLVVPTPMRYELTPMLEALSVVAIVAGMRWNRPPSTTPWYLLAVGMLPYGAADVIWGLYQVRGQEVPFPSVPDV